MGFAGALVCTWSAAVSGQLKRIEGHIAPLANAQRLLGALLAVDFIFPTFVWQAILFRPDTTSTELTYRLNDLAWRPFVGIVSTGVLECLSIGAAILIDQRATPVFPRWAGCYNIFVASTIVPAGLVVFYKRGPFAWNGLLAWWLLVVSFFTWMIVMTVLVLGNLGQQQAMTRAGNK